jgi:5'-nucleotidase/UDP-sugar diphosphatase
VRCTRSSLRITSGSALRAACAMLTLVVGAACGGGTASAPTQTVVPSASAAAVPAPSPQRPPLASPVASPSVAASSPAAATATVVEAAGDSYEVQSGDTLATIAQQFYGDGTQWRRIYDANKDAIGADPDKLKLGMMLKIPPKQP